MSDTQWPRYQVFVQPEPGDPFFDWGTVHAPDEELALLNARDVFARRPPVNAMWVVPAEAIYSQTRQELEDRRAAGWNVGESEQSAPEDLSPGPGRAERVDKEPYVVFSKPKPAGMQTLLGSVDASHPQEALRLALETFAGQFPTGQAPHAWWVFPARLRIQSDPQDADSLFTPALEKPFRLSTDFHVVTEMRSMRRSR